MSAVSNTVSLVHDVENIAITGYSSVRNIAAFSTGLNFATCSGMICPSLSVLSQSKRESMHCTCVESERFHFRIFREFPHDTTI